MQGGKEIEDDYVNTFICGALNSYVFELYDMKIKEGFEVPDHIAEIVRQERLKEVGELLNSNVAMVLKMGTHHLSTA